MTDTLDVLSSGCAGETISIGDLTSTLGPKCFAGLLFLLAAPNMFPTPPFVDIVLGVPLMILSAQLIFGVRRPWLPDWILRREVSTEKFALVATKVSAVTRKVEIVLKRRLDVLTGTIGRRLIGLICLALAIILVLPLPLNNVLPGAAISLFALGLLSRDGVPVLGGIATTIASAALAVGFGYGVFEVGEWVSQLIE
ncbi:exopolysaccharide biosynthesis protein ExoD [Sphingomonas sp. DBB INV C78]|uniref:exopolysaccharide biosynthesis protein n=1 Tax=Sphingomonas sp. DBB INV C78 TaxID=3349434 RepID=UPI0036D34F54